MSKLPNWISRREIVNGLVRLLKEPPYDTPYCPGAWFERLPSEDQEPWLYRVYEDGLMQVIPQLQEWIKQEHEPDPTFSPDSIARALAAIAKSAQDDCNGAAY